MTSTAIDVQMPLAYSSAIIWRAEAMTLAKTRLNFTQTLVMHAIKGRIHDGAAVATDRLIGLETALSPSTVRDVRKELQAADLLDARMVTRGRVEADDEYEIVIRAPEPAAAS